VRRVLFSGRVLLAAVFLQVTVVNSLPLPGGTQPGLVLVVVAALALVLVGRGLLVPRSYGAHGPYRFDNVREQMEVRAPAHAGPAACGECHPDEAARRAAGSHKAVSCEVCHGPLRRHVKPDGVVTAPAVDRSPALCARCHRKLEGRPARFPQVVLEEHVPGPLEERACLGCHDPHAPKP
jgi:hypothetical protein